MFLLIWWSFPLSCWNHDCVVVVLKSFQNQLHVPSISKNNFDSSIFLSYPCIIVWIDVDILCVDIVVVLQSENYVFFINQAFNLSRWLKIQGSYLWSNLRCCYYCFDYCCLRSQPNFRLMLRQRLQSSWIERPKWYLESNNYPHPLEGGLEVVKRHNSTSISYCVSMILRDHVPKTNGCFDVYVS